MYGSFRPFFSFKDDLSQQILSYERCIHLDSLKTIRTIILILLKYVYRLINFIDYFEFHCCIIYILICLLKFMIWSNFLEYKKRRWHCIKKPALIINYYVCQTFSQPLCEVRTYLPTYMSLWWFYWKRGRDRRLCIEIERVTVGVQQNQQSRFVGLLRRSFDWWELRSHRRERQKANSHQETQCVSECGNGSGVNFQKSLRISKSENTTCIHLKHGIRSYDMFV